MISETDQSSFVAVTLVPKADHHDICDRPFVAVAIEAKAVTRIATSLSYIG